MQSSKPRVITLVSPAKVNLILKVGGRGNDGMHTLDSLVCFTTLSDQIDLRLSSEDSITWDGIALNNTAKPSSLQLARDAFRQATDWQHPVAIHISKNIPIAAGLGGGSGNAAAVIKGMEELAQMRFPADLAMALGADVPLQLAQLLYSNQHSNQQPCLWRMEGVGETITPISFADVADLGDFNLNKNMGVVLVKPNLSLATAKVFAEYAKHPRHPRHPPRYAQATSLPLPLPLGDNDLEATACRLAPPLSECLANLRQLCKNQKAIACGMSGSGASCFILFSSPAHASRALESESADGTYLSSLWHWVGGLV